MTFYSQCKKGNKLSFSTKPCNNYRKPLYFIYLELCKFLKAEALEKYEISGSSLVRGGEGVEGGEFQNFKKDALNLGKMY